MFDIHKKTYLATVAPISAPLVALQAFAAEHRDALLDAAELLGGKSGERRAQAVLDGLAGDAPPARRTLRACDELLDLLTLEHVHDPSREESARFAALDPASSVVEEICLLADALADALMAYRESAASDAGRRAAA